MQSYELRSLLEKYADDTISGDEFKQLWKTLNEIQFEKEWHDAIGKVMADPRFRGLSSKQNANERLAAINLLISEKEQAVMEESAVEDIIPVVGKAPVIRFSARRLLQYAASAIVVLSAAWYLATRTTVAEHNETAVQQKPTAGPIKPGTQKAMLTLSDGTRVALDDMANGTIATQGATRIVKSAGGQIRYQALVNDINTAAAFNTLSTPRGGQFELTLPDGTNVWLNAESSISYPISFTGNAREVTITGEAYFEVKKDKTRSFRVKAGEQEIEVMGTHFNVNAYDDEGQVKTSLLEGSVKVNRSVLMPGQAYRNGKIEDTDTDQDVAWRNGIFNFNNQSLGQVMRQLARWYDIEVVFPDGVPQKEYGGEMGRNLTLEQVLKGLESTGIHFELKGRKLIVKS